MIRDKDSVNIDRPRRTPGVELLEKSGSRYWTPLIKSLFDCLWTGQVSGNNLIDSSGNGNNIAITGKDFTGSAIPYTSSATFKMSDLSELKTDDTDLLWYSGAGSQKSVTPLNLIELDYEKTIVWYDGATLDIIALGLLKSTVTVNQLLIDLLTKKFHLWFLWDGTGIPNAYGYGKSNRYPSILTPVLSSATIENANKDKVILTFDNALIEDFVPAISTLTLAGKTISGISISGTVVTVTVTVSYSYGDVVTISYTKPSENSLKSLSGGEVESFTDQAVTNNIASPYGPELIVNGDFSVATGWVIGTDYGGAQWSISGGKANYLAGNYGRLYRAASFTSGESYKLEFDISDSASNAKLYIATSGGVVLFTEYGDYVNKANGHHTETVHCSNTQGNIELWSRASGGTFSIDNLSIKKIL